MLAAPEAPTDLDAVESRDQPNTPPAGPTPVEATEPGESGPRPTLQPSDHLPQIDVPAHEPQGADQPTGEASQLPPEFIIGDTSRTASSLPAAKPAASWYADPSGRPGFRYFDGNEWTDHYSSVSHQPPRPVHPHSTAPQPHLGNGEVTRTNRLAVWSLISSLVGFLCGIGSIIGIVLAIVALNQIKRTAQHGRGFAISGLLIGVLSLIVFLVWYILTVSHS